MYKHIQAVEEAQTKKRRIPEFSPGDTVVVSVRVKEGNRERLQAFEGVVIGIRNRGLHSAFTVRKISHGEGVERVFQTYSPLIENIKVKRRGDVRQAKLYYLRELTGKAARIKERLGRYQGEGFLDITEEEAPAEEVAAAEQVAEQTAEAQEAPKKDDAAE